MFFVGCGLFTVVWFYSMSIQFVFYPSDVLVLLLSRWSIYWHEVDYLDDISFTVGFVKCDAVCDLDEGVGSFNTIDNDVVKYVVAIFVLFW
jgi:hypothetical protein